MQTYSKKLVIVVLYVLGQLDKSMIASFSLPRIKKIYCVCNRSMVSWKEMVWVSFPSAQQLVAGIKPSWQCDHVSVAHRCLADSAGAALELEIDMWFYSPWQPQPEQPNSQKRKIETHPLTRPATVELWKRPWKQRRKKTDQTFNGHFKNVQGHGWCCEC